MPIPASASWWSATASSAPSCAALDPGRLTWAGFRSDVADCCFASDVVVLTSDNEGTPVSLIEALAAGTPVVSTRVGGVDSVVTDGITGFTVPRDDEPAFVAAVRRVLGDTEVSAAARAHAPDVAARHSLGRLTDDVERIYRTLLA
jgi:glycosyltransferase involved in cell wall biosynthesis